MEGGRSARQGEGTLQSRGAARRGLEKGEEAHGQQCSFLDGTSLHPFGLWLQIFNQCMSDISQAPLLISEMVILMADTLAFIWPFTPVREKECCFLCYLLAVSSADRFIALLALFLGFSLTDSRAL